VRASIHVLREANMLHSFPAALLVCAALVPTAAWSADPADPATPVPSAGYRSMIDGYRSHAAAPVGPWRDANDRVGRQVGAHAHAAHADQSMDQPVADPHAAHPAPAEGAPAHDHCMPAADGAAQRPHACPMKKEGGHAHH
jgi:hypothetical protein